ncbi:MAG TPA: phage/plasmid primase, P4 family [Candidatus Omnitrophota bacterium]|nr:phage/plasmid primase, P4 family [Candidatus Omnitrophota bacterium]
MKIQGQYINLNEIAKTIASGKALIFSAGQFFHYEEGVYKAVSDYQIKALIKEKLGDLNTIRSNEEVLRALQIDVFKRPDELNFTKTLLLNLKNKMLNITDMTLSDHDPQYFSTIQFDVKYDLNSSCPVFKKTVLEWLENEEKVNLLQEFLGYCLTRDTRQEKILFLIGSGANGKSTLLFVIESILGKENCCAIPLEKLSDKFSLAQLLGKAVNIASETPSKSFLCDEKLKAIVSGDLVQAEKKFQSPFSFRPFAKFIVACNEIPRTEDKTNALYRRLLILRFGKSYGEGEQDRELKHKLIVEKDGIFLWMLEGLQRLRERGHFIESKESVDEVTTYRKENNTLLTFVDEECDLSEQGVTSKDLFHKRYSAWCVESGHIPLNKNMIRKSLKQYYDIGENLVGPSESRTRVWTGISLKSVQSVQTFSHQ